jgi:hypothetical protein
MPAAPLPPTALWAIVTCVMAERAASVSSWMPPHGACAVQLAVTTLSLTST